MRNKRVTTLPRALKVSWGLGGVAGGFTLDWFRILGT